MKSLKLIAATTVVALTTLGISSAYAASSTSSSSSSGTEYYCVHNEGAFDINLKNVTTGKSKTWGCG